MIRLLKSKNKSKFANKDINIIELENAIKNKIGLHVSIKNKKDNSGQVILNYKSQDQLDHLIEVIKINY